MPFHPRYQDYYNLNQYRDLVFSALQELHRAIADGNRLGVIRVITLIGTNSIEVLEALLQSPDPLHWFPTQQWGKCIPCF